MGFGFDPKRIFVRSEWRGLKKKTWCFEFKTIKNIFGLLEDEKGKDHSIKEDGIMSIS